MKNIAKLREQAGLTQAAFAVSLGVDRSSVAKWEAAGVYPRAQLLPLIAKILKCSIDDLFK